MTGIQHLLDGHCANVHVQVREHPRVSLVSLALSLQEIRSHLTLMLSLLRYR